MSTRFVFQVGPPATVHVEGEEHHLCARWEESSPPELHKIERIEVQGNAAIGVSEVSLAHARLGEIVYVYGKGIIDQKEALIVFTEGSSGGKSSIRFS